MDGTKQVLDVAGKVGEKVGQEVERLAKEAGRGSPKTILKMYGSSVQISEPVVEKLVQRAMSRKHITEGQARDKLRKIFGSFGTARRTSLISANIGIVPLPVLTRPRYPEVVIADGITVEQVDEIPFELVDDIRPDINDEEADVLIDQIFAGEEAVNVEGASAAA